MTKWVTKKLGEIGDIISGGTPATNNEAYWDGDIPFVTPLDLGREKVIDKTIRNVTELGLANSSANKIKANSLAMSTRAPIGLMSIVKNDFSTNQGCKSIQFHEDQDPEFHYYNLSYNVEKIKRYGQGTTFMEISKTDFSSLEFLVPESLAEQRRIAGILSSADGAIAASEALIAKYRNIKRGLLTTLLQPKEGWKKVKLGECLKQKPDYGINAPAVAYDNNLPTYLRITDITEDGYYSKNDVVSVADPDAYKYKMEEGDLVFARTGASVGKTYLYNPQDGILVFAGFLIRVKTDENILLSSFFKYQTQTQQYKNWIANNSMRTGQPGINGNEYETFSFYLPYKNGQPDLAEQRRIAEILSSVDAKIAAEEKVVEKYKGVKKGLMEEMLGSGKD